LLRAWRGFAGLCAGTSGRSWLYAIAQLLASSTASVNSAPQRARAAVAERL
jgi:DNA-directed RNA polymerase specialized sigma24 family protein